jgi:DNA-binding winged helix-turn-helix (wHTH) protein
MALTAMVEKLEYRLDLGDERLWLGDQPVAISNKAFQLLRLLVDNPSRLLTKDRILDAVWGEVWVSEGLIKEYIHDLRSALGDDPKQPRFIETVHGRGYRFLGGIDKANDPAGAEAPREQGTDPPSLVVLPFANLSDDPKQAYFSDGITEDIITELSRFSGLLVIARRTRRRLCDGRQRSAGRRSLEDHRAAYRGGERWSPLGREVRSRAGGHL